MWYPGADSPRYDEMIMDPNVAYKGIKNKIIFINYL